MKVRAVLDVMPTSVLLMPQTQRVGCVVGSLVASCALVYVLVRVARWCSTPIITIRRPPEEGEEDALSAEDEEEIDRLREMAIRRRLRELTVSLNEDGALPSRLDEMQQQPSSTTLFLPTGNDEDVPANRKQEQTDGIEEEATSDKTDQAEEQSSQTFPLLAHDLDGRSAAATAPPKCSVRIKLSDGNEEEPPPVVVLDECPICHEEFAAGDRATRSSHPACRHVFHERCIVDWLVTLGRTRSKAGGEGEGRRRRLPKALRAGLGEEERGLLDYELECPCCRRDFADGPSLGGGGARGEEEV